MARSSQVALAATILLVSLLASGRLASAQSDNPVGESLKWIALGDSYSAGVGSNANPARNLCQRQQDAYPIKAMEILELKGWEFWSDRIPGSFRSEWHHACIGAVTDDYYNEQDVPDLTGGWWNPKPQRSHLDKDTQIVTLSMGGNDLGFANVVVDCIWFTCNSFDPTAKDRFEHFSSFQELEIDLAGFYLDIAGRIDNDGHIFVMGYPELFSDPSVWRDNEYSCEGFTASDARRANQGLQRLNDTVSRAIQTANRRLEDLDSGVRVRFVDVRDDFSDKGLCSEGVESYIRGVSPQTTSPYGPATDSFHPSSIGYGVMARELASCMEDVILDGGRCDEISADEMPIFDGSSTSTVMVVDVSSSMEDPSPVGTPLPKINAAVDAAQALISVVEIDADEGAQHSVGLVAFSTAAQVITPSTTNLARASSAAAGLRASGDTDIGDGLSRGIQTVPDSADLKRIVLLSDGEITDGLSQDQVLAQVVPLAEARDIAIDVIGFAEPGSLDESFLQSIADATGGNVSFAATAQDLRLQFVRARHEATGTVAVNLGGELDANSNIAIAEFDVPAATSQLVATLGHEGVSDIVPVLLDPLGRLVPAELLRVVGTNPVTVAVDDPLPGRWSIHVNEPERPVEGDRLLWQPPVDGSPAGALIQQDGVVDGVPYILVVSTRSGKDPEVAVAITQRSSLPWLAAGVLAAMTGLLGGGLAVVGTTAGTPMVRSKGDGPSDRTGSVEVRGATIAAAFALTVGLFLAIGAMVGGFGG